MSFIDDIHARVPVNRLAVWVSGPGENYEPRIKIQNKDSDTPLAIGPIPQNSNLRDLTGVRFGRFRVIGYSRDFKRNWVVRCDCGIYTTRRTRAIENPGNDWDRCDRCRHLAVIKKSDVYRRTGRDTHLRDF